MSRRPLLSRLLISVSLLLVAAAPAAADLGSQKHAVADRIAALHNRIDAARAHEQALTTEIGSVTSRIRSLEAQVGDVSTRLGTLQEDLTLHRTRLAKIQSLYQLQTQQLHFLKRQYAVAVKRLDQRLVSAYETGEPSTIEVLLGARNLQDMLDQIDYLNRIANQDKQIVAQVAGSRGQMRQARLRTAKMQTTVAAETRVISYRTAQQAAIRDQLLAARGSLSSARDAKQHDLAATSAQERQWTSEADALSAVSAQLTAQIQAAQAAPPQTPNPADNSSPTSSGTPAAPAAPASSGLIWPVSGPITSPFGMRWGSLHPGIDIGAPMGTPIKAAAAGTVIVAAFSGGYGNLVVIDHGNGLATAYAHQSQIAVSVGQQVTQGQVIGYVGSTGFSTGPHLHFEVRVNGSPVDPMGYL